MLDDYFGIVGRTLAGSFRVEEVIAEGGYAVVYRAEHVAFRAPVALKCLKVPGTVSPGQSVSFVETFREEAEILFHLSASIPEVVRPLHADVITLSDGTYVPYLVMEWVEGKPLDSIVILREQAGQPPLGLRELLAMLSPIARAIHRAHRFEVPGGGIVSVTHCDLKPENIVITERETPVRAKILDFGIAKARDGALERVGNIEEGEASPFTPNYGAPEQWAPRRFGQTGPWTDVWGMALTLTECLTGQPVIEGDMRSMMDQALDPDVRPTPGERGAAVTPEVEAVFQRALALDPRDRYTSIEAFWRALERVAGVASVFGERAPKGGVAAERTAREAAPEPAAAATAASERGTAQREPRPADAAGDGPLDIDDPFADVARPEPLPPPAIEADEALDSGEFYLPPSQKPRKPPRRARPGGLSEDSGIRGPAGGNDEQEDDDAPSSARRPAGGHPPLSGPISLAEPSLPPPKAKLPPVNPSASAAAAPRAPAATPAFKPATHSEGKSWSRRLVAPVSLVVLALVLTVVDTWVANSGGGYVEIGPLRLRWIAWMLAGLGILLALWTLFAPRHEE